MIDSTAPDGAWHRTTVGARLLFVVASLSLAALALPACDDGGTDPDTVEETPQADPGLTIFSFDVSTTEGFAPLEVDFEVLFETKDPAADAVVYIDFGDGSDVVELATQSSLGPRATDEELVTPEERTVDTVHIYEDAGEYEVRTWVVDTTNSNVVDEDGVEGPEYRSAEESVSLTVEELPDLIATGITANADGIAIDDVFNVDFTVLNDGTDIERGFFVQLWLLPDPNVTLEQIQADPSLAYELTVYPTSNTGLARGQELSDSVAVQICRSNCDALREQLGDAPLYPAMLVDPPNAARPELNLEEGDETNNFRVSRTGVTLEPLQNLPDLLVTDIIANPALTDVLTSVSVTFTVENVGIADANNVTYAIYLSEGDRTLDPNDIPLDESELSFVASGGRQVIADLAFTLDTPITLPGEYYVIVRADDDGSIEEINESNNTAAATRVIDVTGAQIQDLDLGVQNFVVAPDATFVGGQLTVGFDTVNLGDGDPGSYQCAIFLSPDQTLEPATDNLIVLVGEPTLISTTEWSRVVFISQFTPAGTYYAFVSCDYFDEIIETDETNNVAGPSQAITVSAQPLVDYTVQNLSVMETTVAENDNLNLTVEVCNDGQDVANPILVRGYISADDVIETTDPSFASFLTTTASLATGQCETVTLSGKVDCLPFVDVYTVGVIVDPTNGVIETDEANNTITAATDGLTITGDAASFCTCVEDSLDTTAANNTQMDASTLTLTGVQPKVVAVPDLRLCDAADFYAVEVNRGDTVTATITFDVAKGDLDMRLYDPTDMASPFVGTATTGTEAITEEILGNNATETIYIEVFPKNGGGRNYYDLDISVDAAPIEPELQVTAIDLNSGTFPSASDTIDWDVTVFNDGLTDATSVSVTSWISTNTVVDASDIEVGTQVIPTVGTIDSQTINFTYDFPMGSTSQTYYIIAQVDPMNAIVEVVETNNQGNSVQWLLDADCTPDGFEGPNGNDDLASAYPLNPGTGFTEFNGLSVCNNGRDDYYLVCAPAGEPFNHIGAILPSPSFPSAIEVELFDLDGTSLGLTVSNTDALSSRPVPEGTCTTDMDCATGQTCNGSSFCADGAGDYCVYARFAMRSTSTAIARPYDIIVDRVAPNAANEPTNELRADAIDFTPTTQVLAADTFGNATSRADEDWYFINLEPGIQFTADIYTADREVRLELRQPSLNFVFPFKPETINVGGSSTLKLDMKASKAGSGLDRPSAYQITLDGLAGVDLVVENVSTDLAEADNGQGVLTTWRLANKRLDPVGAPVSYSYYLSTDATLDGGDYLVDGDVVAGPGGFGFLDLQDKVFMTLPTDLFGDLNLIIEADTGDVITETDETNNTAIVPLVVRQLCLADALEGGGNETIATATVATVPAAGMTNSTIDLTACAGDVDVYEFAIPAGATVDFTIDQMVVWSYGDVDLFLLDQFGAILDRSDALDSVSETVSYTATSATTVYLQVLPYRNDYTNRYDLDVTRLP